MTIKFESDGVSTVRNYKSACCVKLSFLSYALSTFAIVKINAIHCYFHLILRSCLIYVFFIELFCNNKFSKKVV